MKLSVYITRAGVTEGRDVEKSPDANPKMGTGAHMRGRNVSRQAELKKKTQSDFHNDFAPKTPIFIEDDAIFKKGGWFVSLPLQQSLWEKFKLCSESNRKILKTLIVGILTLR